MEPGERRERAGGRDGSRAAEASAAKAGAAAAAAAATVTAAKEATAVAAAAAAAASLLLPLPLSPRRILSPSTPRDDEDAAELDTFDWCI